MGPSQFTAYIRTLVPIVVGWLAGAGITGWLGVDDQLATVVVSGVVTVGYYGLVRVLERQWPQAGVLLGIPNPPEYTQAQVTAALGRTLVPFLVAVAVHFGAGRFLDDAALTNVVTFLVSSGYYTALSWLEDRAAWVGWFLGFGDQPWYAATSKKG